MKILVVNDDGINAPGLAALADALRTVADVDVVAPTRQHSGASSAITINRPINVHKTYKDDSFYGYAVEGTPADCVKLALRKLLDYTPDYIFSGINPGANLSIDVHYSGTVAAAYEGLQAGITSCALSLSTWYVEQLDFAPVGAIALKWLDFMQKNKSAEPVLYNLNAPSLPLESLKGFMPSQLTGFSYVLDYDRHTDQDGQDSYSLAKRKDADVEGSDVYYIKRGYVSVTPLTLADRTNHSLLDKMKGVIPL